MRRAIAVESCLVRGQELLIIPDMSPSDGRCPSPCSRILFLGVVEKHVEVARGVAERPQQERNLSTMMNPMGRPVLQKSSQGP